MLFVGVARSFSYYLEKYVGDNAASIVKDNKSDPPVSGLLMETETETLIGGS